MYKVIQDDHVVDLLTTVTYIKFLKGTSKRTITDPTNAEGFVGSDKKSIYILEGKIPPPGYEKRVAKLISICSEEYKLLQARKQRRSKILVSSKLHDLRYKKINSLEIDCKQAITSGVSVELSDGAFHHFTLSLEDQLNLVALKNSIAQGQTKVMYHASGELVKLYSAKDILKVVSAADEHKLKHITYYNLLKHCIFNMYSEAEIDRVFYGIPLDNLPVPAEFKLSVKEYNIVK